jgi:8-oxo-dGTP diphosphatase
LTGNARVPRAIQTFEVSLKAFIVREQRLLVLREADSGFWELPGGRIDVGEEWAAHEAVLAREISEELGPDFRVALERDVTTWVRQRPSDGVFQFVVGRFCRHVGGEAALSDEHSELAWVDRTGWQRLAFPPTSDYARAFEAFWRAREASP